RDCPRWLRVLRLHLKQVAAGPAAAPARPAVRHSAATRTWHAQAPTDPIEELRHAIDLVVVLPIREGQQFALERRQPVGVTGELDQPAFLTLSIWTANRVSLLSLLSGL